MQDVTRSSDPPDPKVSAGEKLRALRESKKNKDGEPLTLAEAGKLVGVGKTTWHKWEQGAEPAVSMADLIARVFGCQVSDIWGWRELPERVPEDESPADDAEAP